MRKVGSQEIPEVTGKFGLGSTKWSREKANSVVKRTHWSQQTPFSNNTREDSTHEYPLRVNTEIRLITFFVAQDGKALCCQQKTRPGTDHGSDHQLLIAKFRLKVKRVEKTTRRFRYDLNQIPYDCTVEVTDRFKGLDLVYRVPEKLWMEVHNTI